jgi:hypothetical protein
MLLLWLGGYGYGDSSSVVNMENPKWLHQVRACFFCGLVATVSFVGGYAGFFIWWLRFLYLVATQVSFAAWWLRMFLLLVATVSLFGGFGFFCGLVATGMETAGLWPTVSDCARAAFMKYVVVVCLALLIVALGT